MAAETPAETVWPRFPASAPGMRIGLLGGSFNPPHDGHRQITLEALARLDLDRIWWLVSPGNPLKDHGELGPLGERLQQATELAAHPQIDVTGVEAALGTSYTALTLQHIRKRHRGVHFVWLMGADNLAQFHRWRDWRRIMAALPVAVLDRPGWRLAGLAAPAAIAFAHARLPETRARDLASARPPAWSFLSVPLSPLSSTALREKSRLKPPLRSKP